MPRGTDRFEEFHEGLNAGFEAGQSRDLLYAAGFLAGFLWGAWAGLRQSRRREFETVPKTA